MDAFFGEIRAFPFMFTPQGWLPCDGRVVAIQQYQALAALLGTRFGGDGKTTIGLPNLQGQVVMGSGSGPGLTPRTFAQTVGTAGVTLTPAQGAAAHTHSLTARNAAAAPAGLTGTAGSAQASLLSRASTASATPGGSPNSFFVYDNPPITPTTLGTQIAPAFGRTTGGVDPHSNQQPYLVFGYFICAQVGTWPQQPD